MVVAHRRGHAHGLARFPRRRRPQAKDAGVGRRAVLGRRQQRDRHAQLGGAGCGRFALAGADRPQHRGDVELAHRAIDGRRRALGVATGVEETQVNVAGASGRQLDGIAQLAAQTAESARQRQHHRHPRRLDGQPRVDLCAHRFGARGQRRVGGRPVEPRQRAAQVAGVARDQGHSQRHRGRGESFGRQLFPRLAEGVPAQPIDRGQDAGTRVGGDLATGADHRARGDDDRQRIVSRQRRVEPRSRGPGVDRRRWRGRLRRRVLGQPFGAAARARAAARDRAQRDNRDDPDDGAHAPRSTGARAPCRGTTSSAGGRRSHR